MQSRISTSGAHLVEAGVLFLFMCSLAYVTTAFPVFYVHSAVFKFDYTPSKIAYSVTCAPMAVAASQKQQAYKELAVAKKSHKYNPRDLELRCLLRIFQFRQRT